MELLVAALGVLASIGVLYYLGSAGFTFDGPKE